MLSAVGAQSSRKSPCSDVGGYFFFLNEKKAFFHLLLYKAKPLKSFCSVSPPTHTDGCMGGTAGLRRL